MVSVLVLASATAAGVILTSRPTTTPERHGPAPAATAPLVRTDLVETQSVAGTLGYGAARPLHNRLAGIVTKVADSGDTVRRGGRLYSVDGKPVVLMYGSTPMYRRLAPGVTGGDVRQLERNLRALGHHGFTVDAEYTSATDHAVRRWQEALGLAETGEIELGRVAFLPGAIRVAAATVHPGQRAESEAQILSYTETNRVVTADLEVTERSLAHRGDRVTVTLPGSRTVQGKITHIGTVAVAADEQDGSSAGQQGGAGAASTGGQDGSAGDQQAGAASAGDTAISITCSVRDQRALGDLDGAPVRVALTNQRREDVLAAPVASLLALSEGGYGVRVVRADGSRRVVPVRTGLFAGGRVEVSGPDLAEGTVVETAPS
jgi:peptidoglycan hydrolase-like protein with peptidoglycan-binding domain